MYYDILMTRESHTHFIGRVLTWPDIVISGNDELTVLQQIKAAIAKKQRNSRVIRLEVPVENGDSWLQYAGMWKDDPDWEAFEAELQSYRQSGFND